MMMDWIIFVLKVLATAIVILFLASLIARLFVIFTDWLFNS